MLKKIEKRKFDLCSFPPFREYMENFNDDFVNITQIKEDYDFLEIDFDIEGKYYKIYIFKDKEKEWGTIYQYKDEKRIYNIEQVEFMSFNEKYYNHEEYDAVIKYASIITDSEFVRVIHSVYSYKDNNMLTRFEKKRKFEIAFLDKVYRKGMNLTELIYWTDKNVEEFYEIIDLKDNEITELKLHY